MLIFRRLLNCVCTASGTVTLYEWPYATLVNQCSVWLLKESDGTRCCTYTIEPHEDEHNNA